MTQEQPLAEALAASPSFADLGPSEVEGIAELGRVEAIDSGGLLMRQGDPADGLWVVLSGEVDVLVEHESGRVHELAVVGPGGLLGEVGLVDEVARTATVRARGPVRAFHLERVAFDSLVDMGHPAALKLSLQIARVLARRLATVNRQLVDALSPAGPRPAREWLSLSERLLADSSA